MIGGSGFVGRELVGSLKSAGAEVVVGSSSGTNGLRADVTDYAQVKAVIEPGGFDAVVNLAGVGVTRGSASEQLMDSVNALGAANVGRAVLGCAQPPWLVHVASSVEVPESELPESRYGATKAAGTKLLAREFADAGAPFAIAVLHNTYGPGQPAGRFVCSAISSLSRGEELVIRHPHRVRDFCLVTDVGRRLAEVALEPGGKVATFEIGTGVGTTLSEAAGVVAGVVGADPGLVVWDDRRDAMEDEHAYRVADRDSPGFLRCPTGFEEGISLTVEVSR